MSVMRLTRTAIVELPAGPGGNAGQSRQEDSAVDCGLAKRERAIRVRGTIDPKFLDRGVAKLEVVEHLRNVHGIHGAVKDFRVEDCTCSVSFKGPGHAADVFIDRATGRYELTETRGKPWATIVDTCAPMITAVSLTGGVLLFILPTKRPSGLLIAVAGAILSYLAYLAWVPY